ncbi:MAG: T9SS type A sorting domain-containing protein [Balneola sp.]
MKPNLLVLWSVLVLFLFSGTVSAQGIYPTISYPSEIDIMWQLEQSQQAEILIGATRNYDSSIDKQVGLVYLFRKEFDDSFDFRLSVTDSAVLYTDTHGLGTLFTYLPPHVFIMDTVFVVDGETLVGLPDEPDTERSCLLYCKGGNTPGRVVYTEFKTYDDSTVIALQNRSEFNQSYQDIVRLRNRNGNLIPIDTMVTGDALPFYPEPAYGSKRSEEFWYIPILTASSSSLLKINMETLNYQLITGLPFAATDFQVLNDTLYVISGNNRIELIDLNTGFTTGTFIDEAQIRSTHPSYGRNGNQLYSPGSNFFPNLITDSLHIYGGLEVVWDPLKNNWVYTGRDYNPDKLVYHEDPYLFFRSGINNRRDYRIGTFDVKPVYAFSSEPSYVNGLFLMRDYLGNSYNLNPSLIATRAREDGQLISASESFFTFEPVANVPVDFRMVIMIDNSFSVGTELPQLRQSAVEIIQSLPEDLEIALYSFSGSSQLLVDYTSDKQLLVQAVNNITLGGTTTNLHGSIITGLGRWDNTYSETGLELGSMIVITDGEDTQGTNTSQDVLNARGDKQIITIKIGNSSAVIQEFGNGGNFRFSNFGELLNGINVITKRLNEDAKNMMWFSYASPKRGDQNRVFTLEFLGLYNYNTTSRDAGLFSNILELSYNSANFSDIIPGVYVNRSVYDTDGLTLIEPMPGDSLLLEANTLLPIFPINHRFELSSPSNPGLTLRVLEQDSSLAYLSFEADIQLDGTDTVIVRDIGNSYIKKIPIAANVATSLEENIEHPITFELFQNYPNPFNPATSIQYSLPVTGNVRLEVRNILGQLVSILVDEPQVAGNYTIFFNGSALSSGVYFYTLQSGDRTLTQRMTLIK